MSFDGAYEEDYEREDVYVHEDDGTCICSFNQRL